MQDESIPYPPRFWWLKRLTLATAIFAVVLTGAWFAWTWEAQRQLQRAIAAARAGGEPIFLAEFAPAPVDDKDNAAHFLKSAADALHTTTLGPSNANLQYAPNTPFPRAWQQMADAAIAANARALDLAREARSRDAERTDWGVRFELPAIYMNLNMLSQLRTLAYVLSDAALHAHLNGDDALALERTSDLMHLAACLDRAPFLISYLITIGIEGLAANKVQVIAMNLRLESASNEGSPSFPSTAPSRRASRDQVLRIIQHLHARETNDGLGRAMLSERATVIESLRLFGAHSRLLQPMFQLDAARMLEEPVYRRLHQSADLPKARAAAGSTRPIRMLNAAKPSGRVRYAQIVSDSLTPPYDKLANGVFRWRAERRMIMVILAIHLYRADHGDWPATLDELVPQYLREIPLDPMVENRALGYIVIRGGLPDGADRPLVYSVDRDGSDDTQSGARPPMVPIIGWNDNVADQWRDIAAWPALPATLPATAPSR